MVFLKKEKEKNIYGLPPTTFLALLRDSQGYVRLCQYLYLTVGNKKSTLSMICLNHKA
jgi:hypothetical protein